MVLPQGNVPGLVDERSITYYGWRVVAVAFTILFLTFGAPTFLLPLIYTDITDEFQWSRAAVTQVATWKFMVAVIIAIILARIIHLTSLRKTIIGGMIITGLTMLGFHWVQSLFTFYLLGALLGACGITMMISMKILVSQWFNEKQGIAIGISLVGASVAGVAVPLIYLPIVESYGWRHTFVILTSGIWFISLPLYIFFGARKPGEQQTREHEPLLLSEPDKSPIEEDTSQDFSSILRSSKFWFILAGLFLIGFVDQGLIQHTPLYLEKDLGFSRQATSAAFALTFAIGIIAKIGFGWLYDLYSIRGIMTCYFLMGVAVFLAFLVSGPLTIGIFVIVRGLAHGGLVADIPVLAKHCFGTRNLSTLISIFTATLTLGYAMGIYFLGAIYNYFGNYTFGFILMLVFSFISVGLLYFVRPDYWLSLGKKANTAQENQSKRSLITAATAWDLHK